MIKKWLWPHKTNNYRPYALRPLGLFIFLVVMSLMPLAYNLTSAHKPQVLGYATDISPYTLYSLTNSQRSSAGLAPLSLNNSLATAAQNKAQDMFANNYWAHTSPTGVTPWWSITNAGYSFSSAGENLAKDFLTSQGVIDGWMASSDHRANILSPSYKDVGFAVENGSLLGSQTTLVVAMYAEPDVSPVAAAPSVTRPTAQSPAPAPTGTTPSTTQSPAPAPTGTTANTKASDLKKTVSNKSTTLGSSAISTNSTSAPSNRPALAAMFLHFGALNWGQKATIFLASSLALASLLAHTAVWRLKKSGRHHIWFRAHPLMQASLLSAIAFVTVASGFGVTI